MSSSILVKGIEVSDTHVEANLADLSEGYKWNWIIMVSFTQPCNTRDCL